MNYINNENINKIICEKFNNGIKNKDIAKELNISLDTVRRILQKNKLGKINMSDIEKQKILNFYENIKNDLPHNFIQIMVNKFSRSPMTIMTLLKQKQVRKYDGVRKYNLNENYFEKIDNPNKAYWLGFIAADGNVSRNTLHIGIHADDHEHLNLFKKDINADNPVLIKEYISKGKLSKISRIDLYSNKLVDDLLTHGIHANKSLTLKWDDCTKNIPENYKIDFVRGFFDGDGSWKNNGSKTTFSIGIANKKFAIELQAWLYNLINLKPTKIYEHKRGNYFYVEKGGIHNIKKLVDVMYNGNRYLSRKYIKVTKAIHNLEDYTICFL